MYCIEICFCFFVTVKLGFVDGMPETHTVHSHSLRLSGTGTFSLEFIDNGLPKNVASQLECLRQVSLIQPMRVHCIIGFGNVRLTDFDTELIIFKYFVLIEQQKCCFNFPLVLGKFMWSYIYFLFIDPLPHSMF